MSWCLHHCQRSDSLKGPLNVPKLPQSSFLNESEFSGRDHRNNHFVLIFHSFYQFCKHVFFFSLVFSPDTLMQPDLFVSPESDGGGTLCQRNSICFHAHQLIRRPQECKNQAWCEDFYLVVNTCWWWREWTANVDRKQQHKWASVEIQLQSCALSALLKKKTSIKNSFCLSSAVLFTECSDQDWWFTREQTGW